MYIICHFNLWYKCWLAGLASKLRKMKQLQTTVTKFYFVAIEYKNRLHLEYIIYSLCVYCRFTTITHGRDTQPRCQSTICMVKRATQDYAHRLRKTKQWWRCYPSPHTLMEKLSYASGSSVDCVIWDIINARFAYKFEHFFV